jgi:hypothetical protein
MGISCGLQTLRSFGRMLEPFVVLDINTRKRRTVFVGEEQVGR